MRERVIRLSEDLLDRLKKRLEDIEGLVFAAIFGSTVKKGFSYHDVDVAIAVGGVVDKYEVILKVLYAVADVLGLDVENIDLVDLDRADIDLKKRVVEEALILVDKDYFTKLVKEIERVYPEYHEYRMLSFREWFSSRDPSSIDIEIVKKRLDFVRSELEFLEEYVLSKSVLEVSSSPVLRRLLERSFQLIVEAVIDVCRHIVSAKGWGPAYTSRDFIIKCGEKGVIESSLARIIIDMISLRNIIIHRYLEIDYEKLYSESRRLVEIVRLFEKQIVEFIKREKESVLN